MYLVYLLLILSIVPLTSPRRSEEELDYPRGNGIGNVYPVERDDIEYLSIIGCIFSL